jgi:hypothetical protein
MTAQHDLDRELTAFLREGAEELPYESFDAVRDRTEQIRQRVFIGPWRTPIMSKFLTYGLGTAAVAVIALLVGAQLFGSPSGGFGSQPTSTPQPTAPPQPSPSPPPPLSQRFTSTQHGISVAYPEAWTVHAATEPWTESTFSLYPDAPHADFLYDWILGDHLFLTLASQPIGDSTPEDWIAAQMAGEDEGCATAEPIAVDGATGLIGPDGCDIVWVTTAGRGYWIQLFTSGDDPRAVAAYDRAWFEEVLATVQLHPEDAVD